MHYKSNSGSVTIAKSSHNWPRSSIASMKLTLAQVNQSGSGCQGTKCVESGGQGITSQGAKCVESGGLGVTRVMSGSSSETGAIPPFLVPKPKWRLQASPKWGPYGGLQGCPD